MLKKKLVMLVCAVMIGCCGCQAKTVEENDTITVNDLSDGLYIMSQEGDFYKSNTSGQNFTNQTKSADAKRVIVSYKNEKAVPTLFADDYLIFLSYSDLPQKFNVEKFHDAGYTVGLYQLSKGTDGTYGFTQSNIINSTSIEDKVSIKGSDWVRVMSINGEAFSDADVSYAGTITGLNLDDTVTLGCMLGTHYTDVTATVDTRVWYSFSTLEINSYQTTKNGYIVLDIPEELKDSYVSIEGYGLMYISSEERP